MARRARRDIRVLARIPFPEYPNVIAIWHGRAVGPAESPPHAHACAEINLVIEGFGTWYIGGDVLEVSVGDGVLLRPETLHHAKWPPGVRFETASVDFVLGIEGRSLFGAGEQGHDSAPPWAAVTGRVLDALSRKPYYHIRWKGLPEWWERFSGEQKAVAGYYRALRVASALLELLARFADPAVVQTPQLKRADRHGLDAALWHLTTRIADPPASLAQLARLAGMSRAKFAKLFHQTVGMPPRAYAMAVRMWIAQTALVSTHAPAATVGGWVGFSSPEHFSRAFRKATGFTPLGYRRRWGAPWVQNK